MVEVNFLLDFIQAVKEFHSTLSPTFQSFVMMFFLVLLILLYVIFVWKLRRFISRKNIFRFDLNKYNTSKNPVLIKIIASAFYFLEYALIIPFIIFSWFIIFTFFLLFLVEESIAIHTILITSAVAIAAIRMCAYLPGYGENLAIELSKILPFTFLGIAVFEPNLFAGFAGRIANRIGELPTVAPDILNYLLFIIVLELALRFFEFLFMIMGVEDNEEPEKRDIE